MDTDRFDTWTRSLSHARSRRAVMGALGLGALGLPGLAGARKRKRKKRKNVTFNEFGCVAVNSFCQNADQCCSGICRGKKGKKRCAAHGSSSCQAGEREASCGGNSGFCVTSSGYPDGVCNTTTGNAAYCQGAGGCAICNKDADCVPFCGPQAACVVCAGCDSGTVCSGPEPGSCAIP